MDLVKSRPGTRTLDQFSNFILHFRLVFTRRIKYPVDYSIPRIPELAYFKYTWRNLDFLDNEATNQTNF